MKTIIEPFRVLSVYPIRMSSREERERLVREAAYNLFRIPARDVIVDLLHRQRARRNPEAAAGSRPESAPHPTVRTSAQTSTMTSKPP